MQASQFPISYKLFLVDEGIFLEGEDVTNRGFTLTADGLPYYSKEPFPVIILWFSGQMDMNKNLIYEGDICKILVENSFGSVTEDIAIMRWVARSNQFILNMGAPRGGEVFTVVGVERIGHELTDPELKEKIIANSQKS